MKMKNKFNWLNIVFLGSLIALSGCKEKTSAQAEEVMKNASKRINVWDEDSLEFWTAALGGEGVKVHFSPLAPLPGEHDPKCRLNEKRYSYIKESRELSIEVCQDIYQYLHKQKKTKVLDGSEQTEIHLLLSSLISEKRNHRNDPIPADAGSFESEEWFEVKQRDGVIRIFHGGEDPRGEPDPKYPHGTLPDLGFLNRLEEIFKRNQ